MQRVNALLTVLSRHQNSDASETTDLELPARDVRVEIEARGEEYRDNLSMARELGKENPILSDRNYSLWKEHVVAYGRAKG